MGQKTREIIFLLDRSYSMAGLETETIKGFNEFLKKETKLHGETLLTTVLFDSSYELLWDGVDASSVTLTENEYFVNGYTALLDAIGKTIYTVKQRQSGNDGRQTIFVITTDGQENSSQEFSYESVQQLIKRQEKAGWEFIFLGANIDVAKEASILGIAQENSFVYEASRKGMRAMYEQVHKFIGRK